MINENHTIGAHQPVVPSYWVGTAVAATGVVTVLVISTLYYYLGSKRCKRSEEAAREVLREAGTDHNTELYLDMECLEVQSVIYPKPSPSIFREGEFLMEVLEGIDNLYIDYGNSDEIDCNSVTVVFEESEKDLDVTPQLEVTQSIRSLSDSKPSFNSRGIDNDLDMSEQVGNGCTVCSCPCPAIVLSEQYPSTIANIPNIQKQGPYSSERGERRADLHPESTMLEVRAIFDTVLSELTEKGDYTKFDDSTIDEIHMVEFPNFESSTPVLHSNSSSPSDAVQIPGSSKSCVCVLNVPVSSKNDHDEATFVPISLSSPAHLSNSAFTPMDTETLLVTQPQDAERSIFHLSLNVSGTQLSGTPSSKSS